MKKNIALSAIALGVLVIIILFFSTAFIVSEIDQAVITQFGRPVRVIAGESVFNDKEAIQKTAQEYSDTTGSNIQTDFGAGLYFKVPFIQKVEYFDDRILEYDSDATQITTGDKKRLMVDNFARWKIANPLLFRQRIKSTNMAQSRLDDIIYSVLRSQLGEYDFIEIVRSTNNILNDTQSEIPNQKNVEIETGRSEIMKKVTENSREAALEYGIYIVDVRMKRADPPEENRAAVFRNMEAERNRIAQKYIEEGQRDATYIRAETDLTVQTILAEANREAQVIRGQADAEAARIFATGFVKDATGERKRVYGFESDPEFFKFVRSLEALEQTIDQDTSFLLDTNNQLLEYLDRIPHK